MAGEPLVTLADLGVRDAGYYAINALRLEKGYRAWGPELSPDYGPVEAGLIGAMGAVWVAVNDALKPLGAKILHQPFTPERVLKALGRI